MAFMDKVKGMLGIPEDAEEMYEDENLLEGEEGESLTEEGDTAKQGVVVVKYYESAAQILPLYKSNLIDIAIIGEPAVSLQGCNSGERRSS